MKIIKRTLKRGSGSHGSDNVYKVLSEGPLTEEQAQQIQKESGFSPCGYGFGDFQSKEVEKGIFFSSWTSYSNCD